MTRLALLTVALVASAANAASFTRHHRRQTNPFEGIPDISSLGFCSTECGSFIEAQKNGDLSGACTSAFASQVGTCIQCIGKSVPTIFLTDLVKQEIKDAMANYEAQCKGAGSPITVDLGAAFDISSSNPASVSGTPTTTHSTGTNIPTTTPTGAGYANKPMFGVALAAMAAVAASF